MCRFLLFKSKDKIDPQEYLKQFASICEKSLTPDGDRQKDGWGVAWKENGSWKIKKSLLPIWQERKILSTIPKTNLFIVHARSAGFPEHKDNLEFNQPYLQNSLCFVFNGMIRGVRLLRQLEGEIGAQKIFSFIQQELKKNSVKDSLQILNKTILQKSREVIGMNIGLVKDNLFFVLCQYSKYNNYFNLCYYQNENLTLVCSEEFGLFDWNKMKKGEIIVL